MVQARTCWGNRRAGTTLSKGGCKRVRKTFSIDTAAAVEHETLQEDACGKRERHAKEVRDSCAHTLRADALCSSSSFLAIAVRMSGRSSDSASEAVLPSSTSWVLWYVWAVRHCAAIAVRNHESRPQGCAVGTGGMKRLDAGEK